MLYRTAPVLSVCLALAVGACAPAQIDKKKDAAPAPEPSAGTPLTQIHISKQFDFEATERVDIHLTIPSSLKAGSPLVIQRQNGMVIYRGAVPTTGSLTIAYPLPKHEKSLTVVWKTPDGQQHTRRLDVAADQTATATLEQ